MTGAVCRDCPCQRVPFDRECAPGSRYDHRLECCMARFQAPMSRQERRALQRDLDKRTGAE
jgi:hypothetical protein